MKEALFYHSSSGVMICDLCPTTCQINDKQTGRCGTYVSMNQKLFNKRYGQIVSLQMDPIEKKPLVHFFPHSHILSAGFFGCNLSCQFCQNHALSFGSEETLEYPIGELISLAKKHNSLGIAFTYNEPFTMYEYIKDTFLLCREEHLKTVVVTNGYINPEPLRQLLPLIDAMNIDLKSMDNAMYQKICHGTIDPVLETIRTCQNRCHVEITYLVIPGENDQEEDFEKLASFLYPLNPEIPVHLSRYFPHYRFTLPPTSLETLRMGRSIVSQKMKYVYLGNVAKGEL